MHSNKAGCGAEGPTSKPDSNSIVRDRGHAAPSIPMVKTSLTSNNTKSPHLPTEAARVHLKASRSRLTSDLGRTVIDYRAAQPLLDAPRQAVSHSRRIARCWASRLPVVHADRPGSAGVHPLAWLHAWDIRSRAEHSALAQGYSPVNRRRLVRKAVEHERSSRQRTTPIQKSDWQAKKSFSSRSPGMAVAQGAFVTLPRASHICVLRIEVAAIDPVPDAGAVTLYYKPRRSYPHVPSQHHDLGRLERRERCGAAVPIDALGGHKLNAAPELIVSIAARSSRLVPIDLAGREQNLEHLP
jgi:hypothetical protein